MRKIAIHGVPRSGTTWLGEILNSNEHTKYCFQPLFSYALKGYLSEASSAQEIEEFFQRLEGTSDPFILQYENRVSGDLPFFNKSTDVSHVIYKEVRYHNILENIALKGCGVKFIFLIRNPYEVMASWVQAPKEFNASWRLDEELILANGKNCGRPEEFYGLARWSEATRIFIGLKHKYPDDVLLVRYSCLESHPLSMAEDIFNFAELVLSDSTRDFLVTSQAVHNDGTYSVYRGDKDARKHWQDVLSASAEKLINEYLDSRELGYLLTEC